MSTTKLKDSSPAPAGVDNKDWARKILEREARGDKRLLPIQVNFAREALQKQQGQA